ncbi:adhesive plaque matrix protein-like [Hyposmocoma kahamanoa]|uniref:adhesive plaque matrix protein-like n=1 Tax=Hyposmocoma kahamanoa TaxID=1477025 RepID=UPI000E6D81A1|nr:adhesive plaque matrix protein-like [Hyposmocoma kahamanoa]
MAPTCQWVGAKGNSTCELSNLDERELNEKKLLLRDPDYDIYVRRFQCEQSPPSPLQFALNDPIEGPSLKPVFRPEIEDTNKPLSDEYLSDLRPFETIRPEVRPSPYRPPYYNYLDRPDNYINQKPDFDRPPSYGLHKPQDIPFKPERPQNIYRPYQNYSIPVDVLYFQDGRPRPPMHWRPDPPYPPFLVDDIPDLYGQTPIRPRPELPAFPSEDSQYIYINRPNRKPPRPDNDPGYDRPPKPVQEYPTKPDSYGPSYPIRPIDPPNSYKPSRPMDYLYRPQDRPTYGYHDQYASNYAQNQYQDNSIYLDIYDPSRPYGPKPMHDRPMYGNYDQNYAYGQQGDIYGGSYVSQNHQSSYGTVTQVDDYNRPVHRPPKPVYENPTSEYGPQNTYKPSKPPIDSPSVIYGGLNDPIKKPDKPNDNSDTGFGYQKPEKPVYNTPSSSSGYGSLQDTKPQTPLDEGPGYGGSLSSSQYFDGYGVSQKPQNTHRPYNPGSGGHLGYGTQSNFNNQGYGLQSQDIYSPTNQYGGSAQQYLESYGSKPVADSHPSHTGNKPSFANDRPSYGNNKPSFNDNRPSYENNKPLYNDDRPSYGGNRPSYSQDVPIYGNKPHNDNLPYGNKPSFSTNRPSYSSILDNNRPLYNKPSNDVPSYNRPPYDKPTNNAPSYNNPSTDAPTIQIHMDLKMKM